MVKKDINFTMFGIIVLLILIVLMVNKNMSEIKNNSAFREENTSLLPKEEKSTANVKLALTNPQEPETLIAQQIENSINYKTPENTRTVLNNIENDLKRYSNPPAVLFYLAYAYEKLNDAQKAVSLYQQIKNNYQDGQLKLYIINAPRPLANNRFYSTALTEEALLRQAKLSEPTTYLNFLLSSPAAFGAGGNEKFYYADLAKTNLINLAKSKPLTMSYEQYARLVLAQNMIGSFFSELTKRSATNLSGYLSEDFSLDPDTINNLQSITNLQFYLTDIKKSGILYYYLFTNTDNSITIELVDDGERILIKYIKLPSASGVSTQNSNEKI